MESSDSVYTRLALAGTRLHYYYYYVQVEGGRKINEELMPDVLHPNGAGMELMLTKCLDPALAGKAVNISPQ